RSSATPWQFNPIALARVSQFDHSTDVLAIRGYSNVGLGYNMSSQAFQLNTEIKAKGVYYDYAEENSDRNGGTDNFIQNNSTSLASYKIDGQLFFERNVFKTDNSGYTHTLTPRLQYYYAPFIDQLDQPDFDTAELSFNYSQVFREERFSGYDRISDANTLSVGLDTGMFRHNDGSQIINIGVAQAFYFSERRVLINASDDDKKIVDDPTLSDDQLAYNEAFNDDIDKKYFRSYSDLALRGQYFINTEHSILLDGVYDPSSSDIQRGGIGWHYQHETGTIVNIGYGYVRYLPKLADTDNDPITPNVLVKQNTTSADMSFYTPLSSISDVFGQNWAFYGRLNWDLEKNETIENLGGLKYESCCWSVYLAMQRERRIYDAGQKIETWENSKYDNHWFVEFELKGLGGMTNSIIRLLEESIEGFNR
ncbi:MAG: LPS-assembly protein LptD, partial [Sinobacterium sp.]|nr:LPS-assembly protein LptD [Sinobacterium sp.]